MLNSFLQFLEQDDSDSIVVAATNLASMLDEALFRRFDEVILYEKPSEAEIRELILNRLVRFGFIGSVMRIGSAMRGDHSDRRRARPEQCSGEYAALTSPAALSSIAP